MAREREQVCSAMMGNLNPGEQVGAKPVRSRQQGLSVIQVIQSVTLRRKMKWILMMMIVVLWVNHAQIVAPSGDAQAWYRHHAKPPLAYNKFPRSRTGAHKHSSIQRGSNHSPKSLRSHYNLPNRTAIPESHRYRRKRTRMRNAVFTGSCLSALA